MKLLRSAWAEITSKATSFAIARSRLVPLGGCENIRIIVLIRIFSTAALSGEWAKLRRPGTSREQVCNLGDSTLDIFHSQVP